MISVSRLSASKISVSAGAKRIVDAASLVLNAGELTVLAGPNGAGKTTLVRALAGLSRCEGHILLGDIPMSQLSAQERAREVAYLPQGHQYHWPMRVRDVVAMGRAPHSDRFNRISSSDREAIEAAIVMTGLTNLADRTITTLSGGERARVALARALATQACVIIADEPTASVDERNQLIIMELLHSVARKGAAVLAIIHDLSLAMRFADRVVLMQNGRLVADGAPSIVLTAGRIADIFGVVVERVETAHGPALIPSRVV
ncbi:MAG: ABC transporter ATP-binding protein [Bradyrhizobiaceae bacterium]|nr:MAG: ABC transporter ATP-binding protein [Bradyrhizobiaceae bacterium]